MILISKLNTLVAVLLAATLLSLIVGLSWPLLIFCIVVLTIYLPLPARINNSLSIRVLITLMLVVSSFQIIGIIFYLLKIDINPLTYNLINAVAATAFAVFAFSKQKIKFTTSDLWTIIVPTLIVGVLVASTIALTFKTDLNSAIIYKTTTSTDESQHLYMLADLIENNSNYTTSIKVYPTGWHLSMSVLIQSFTNLQDKPFINTLVAYYVTKMFSIFMVVASVMALFIVYAKKLLDTPYYDFYLLFALGTIFATLMIVIPNSEINAFYNFTPQYIYFTLLMILLVFNDKKNEKITYIILGAFVLASFFSWILTGVLMALFVGIAFAGRYIVKVAHTLSRFNSTLIQLIFIILFGVCVMLLIIPSGFIGKIVDTMEHSEGWIEGVNQLAYLILFVLVAKEILTSYRRGLSSQSRLVIATYFMVVAAVTVITMLRGYGDELSYYWQKIQFPLLLISIPLAIVVLIRLTQKFSNNVIAPYVLILILLVLSIPNVFGGRSFGLAMRSVSDQQYLHKTKDLNITKPIKNLFETNKFQSTTAVRYIFATSSNYVLDQMVYQLMSQAVDGSSALKRNMDCFPPINGNGGYVGDNAKLLTGIPDEYCGHKVVVVVSNNTINDVKKYLSGKLVISID